MADLKPKGRDEGFSAQDREKGAEWLRGMITKFGPVIKANCHQIVNYKGKNRNLHLFFESQHATLLNILV